MDGPTRMVDGARTPTAKQVAAWIGPRSKKSKSFCTLIPERGRFKALLVFGAAERERVEAILPDLVSHVRDDYATSPTFYDGKWVAPIVDGAQAVADVKRLLIFKRTPKSSATTPSRRELEPTHPLR